MKLFSILKGVLLAFSVIASPGLAAVQVVTTTSDLAAIVTAIGGDSVKVKSLTPGASDPHFAEAKPSMIRVTTDADLLVLVGADLEIGWLQPLLQTARNGKILPGSPGYLDMSAFVPLLDRASGPVSRALGDVHPLGNPHYWLNPGNGLLIARAIAERLKQIDPGNASRYDANLTVFVQELQRRIPQWEAALASLKGQPVISYHTSLRYLADAFGFQIVGQIEPKPGIPPSASHLENLIQVVRGQNVRLLLMEPFYERRSAAYLSQQTGIQVVIIPQSVGAERGIRSYFELFDAIVQAIQKSATS